MATTPGGCRPRALGFRALGLTVRRALGRTADHGDPPVAWLSGAGALRPLSGTRGERRLFHVEQRRPFRAARCEAPVNL